jgi:hypothetical protein
MGGHQYVRAFYHKAKAKAKAGRNPNPFKMMRYTLNFWFNQPEDAIKV